MKSIPSLYIHYPYCKHLCNYCDFYKIKKLGGNNFDSDYQELIKKQLDELFRFNNLLSLDLKSLETIYIGGGTPSLWNNLSSQFDMFWDKNFTSLTRNTEEFTLEVDPGTYKFENLKKWSELGVNRISIGAQAYNDKALNFYDRLHRKDDIFKAVNDCRAHFSNVSIDFLIGGPKESKREKLFELKEALADLEPEHISLYMLSTRKNYPYKRELPSDDITGDIYLEVVEMLSDFGFVQYEVSNFAKPGFRSLHNLNYWEMTNVAALGPSATGYYGELNSSQVNEVTGGNEKRGNSFAFRYKWSARSSSYAEELLLENQILLERTYMGLRSIVGFDLRMLKNQTSLKRLYNKWQNMGYLANESCYFKTTLSPKGLLVLDSLINDLFTINAI